jgi:hypothetical protein
MFREDHETELAHQIRTDYRANGHLFTDMHVRILAIDAHYRWNPIDAIARRPDFKQSMISSGFIDGFKKRNRFSSRQCHLNSSGK